MSGHNSRNNVDDRNDGYYDDDDGDNYVQEKKNGSAAFTVLGIISLLAGIFVFQQASSLVRIESLAVAFGGAQTNMGWVFTAVSALLIAAGACSLVSASGKKRGLVKASAWLFAITAVLALANYAMGDMKIWTYVCAVVSALYFFWLWRNPDY